MNERKREHSEPLFFWFRPTFLKMIIIILFLLGIFFTIIGYLYNTSFRIYMPLYILLGLIMTPFFLKGRHKIVLKLFLVGFNILLLIQGYFLRSTQIMTAISILFIIAGVYGEKKILILLTVVDTIIIFIYVLLGVLSILPEQDPETGLIYANHITVLLPILIASFFTGYVISDVLVQTIKEQESQYNKSERTSLQLMRQEKVQSMQVLAGGIAHDFNNILTSILGNLELIELEDDISQPILEGITDTKKSAFQAQKLTRKLMEFSKSEEISQKNVISLHAFVGDVATFCMHGRKSKIDLQMDDSLHSFLGDQTLISQIVQNLILNADDAMEEGNTIYISAQNLTISDQNSFDLPIGNYVKLNVRDSGCGIKQEDQRKIFDLFFTTKPSGNGIGLSVCKKIASEHNGSIFFESEVGKGTTFSLILPAILETP